MRHPHPRLEYVLPGLAEEMRRGLLSDGRPDLVPEVTHLRVVRAHGCGDETCASFVTTEHGASATSTLILTPLTVFADVTDEAIVFLEVLDRPDIRDVLVAAFGEPFFARGPRNDVSRRRTPACRAWLRSPRR